MEGAEYSMRRVLPATVTEVCADGLCWANRGAATTKNAMLPNRGNKYTRLPPTCRISLERERTWKRECNEWRNYASAHRTRSDYHFWFLFRAGFDSDRECGRALHRAAFGHIAGYATGWWRGNQYEFSGHASDDLVRWAVRRIFERISPHRPGGL